MSACHAGSAEGDSQERKLWKYTQTNATCLAPRWSALRLQKYGASSLGESLVELSSANDPSYYKVVSLIEYFY